jgi:hypothetical protein
VGQGSDKTSGSVWFKLGHEKLSEQRRRQLVMAVRRGEGQRQVARRFKVPVRVVQYWLGRVGTAALEAVDWSDRSSRPHHCPHQVSAALERRIIATRRALQKSPLGFIGAATIAQALAPRGGKARLSVRTIGRVLLRQGALDQRRRVRRTPPPPGWYLPLVAQNRAALDAFDFIEDLCLDGARWLNVLTTRSLVGPICGAWPQPGEGTTAQVLQSLPQHWQEHGRPAYAQFDNDLRFVGPTRYPDTLGQMVSLCLQLGVTPVFVPPAEHGFQNLIESFNALWQAKVWTRFDHPHLASLRIRSNHFIQALQRHRATGPESPRRRPWPKGWQFDRSQSLRGEIIFLRRTDSKGWINVLGHRWELDPAWALRLVRAEVDLCAKQIRCYRLRRQAPEDQPLIKIIPYHFPQKHRIAH